MRGDSAPTRRGKAELGSDAHHDLGLAIGHLDVGRLDRIPSWRFDYYAVLLDGLRCLGPKRVCAAVGRQRCTVEVRQHLE
jgi:hypothetical protein